MDGQIQPAITSSSAGEFRRQPALSDDPALWYEVKITARGTFEVARKLGRIWVNPKGEQVNIGDVHIREVLIQMKKFKYLGSLIANKGD